MTAPFATLEARVNAACLSKLANAEATLPDGSVVSGIFDNGAIVGGVFDVAPGFVRRFSAASSAVDAVEVGDELSIGDARYAVAEIEPDGTGMTGLNLK